MRKHQAELSFEDGLVHSNTQDVQILVNSDFFPQPKLRKSDQGRIRVLCLECSRTFWTGSHLPECPNCGGSDLELA